LSFGSGILLKVSFRLQRQAPFSSLLSNSTFCLEGITDVGVCELVIVQFSAQGHSVLAFLVRPTHVLLLLYLHHLPTLGFSTDVPEEIANSCKTLSSRQAKCGIGSLDEATRLM